MQSVMKNQYSMTPQVKLPRSSFDRSHGYTTTLTDAGYLYPILVDEVVPGDTINCSMTGFARLTTPIHPIMDNLYMDTQFFAVPKRLLWDNWEKFNGAQDNPGDSIDFLVPTITSPASVGDAIGSLSDYLTIPTGVPDLEYDAWWHRAYYKIWNDWYRDQNIQDSLPLSTADGPDLPTAYTLQKRGKRHDYFTSCLPWPQKGAEASIPLGTTAPVVSDTTSPQITGGSVTDRTLQVGSGTTLMQYTGVASTSTANLIFGANTGLQVDLTAATAATINTLIENFRIQEILVKDARGGTRYVELIKAHFGVTSPDFRLQRAEYLGGGSSPINVTPIAQTSSTDATTPQGNLAAFATASLHNHGFTKSFTEHCVIIGLVSVRADLRYQEGLDRMFSRQTRYDYYLPSLATLGEQAVLNKEIFAVGSAVPGQDDGVFGYQERWAEMRHKKSNITGLFRSGAAGTLDPWHVSQQFSPTLPTLSPAFIEETPPLNRVVAVTTEPKFYFDSYFRYYHARPMPVHSIPGLTPRF